MTPPLKQIRRLLLQWYRKHQRSLPWRGVTDPYAVWVSEIMLQQTQVQTVIPYYNRFLSRFPTIESLASATEDEVLSQWSGLGYYRRARLLHKGVQEVVSEYGAQVPKDPKSRLSLPGIGRYTAGAIGSIAFDLPEAIVDGNVARVLSRVIGIEATLGSKESEQQLWSLATELAKGKHPGAFNQSMMELGALVCRKANPECDRCPLSEHCVAKQQGRQQELPVPKPRKRAKSVSYATLVATVGRGSGRSVAMVRSKDGLFAGLWSPPIMQTAKPLKTFSADCEVLRTSLSCRSPCYVGKIEHVLTHRKMTVSVFRATGLRLEASKDRKSMAINTLNSIGISTLSKKILDRYL